MGQPDLPERGHLLWLELRHRRHGPGRLAGLQRPDDALPARRQGAAPARTWPCVCAATPRRSLGPALETISGGTGIPALYNEEEYLAAIDHADLGIAGRTSLASPSAAAPN